MFLAFPLNGRPDWRRPPVITLLLIALNCIIYFGPEQFDQIAARKAATYYAQSELPRIELPRFLDYLKSTYPGRRTEYVERLMAAKQYAWVLRAMEHEGVFDARLKADKVITPSDPDYALWREQRNEYESRRGTPFIEHWGSNPANWRPITAITSVFLHGSFWHLLGNMVFLFAFGYTVELTLGHWRYLVLYLLCGIGGDIGDLIARWGSYGAGIGASGAISGLMAMYVVLYGARRIRFFYQFLFYFDYVTAPAIILLPLWIGTEFLQHWFDSFSNVAHMAHVGGFITGALLAWAYKRWHPDLAVPETRAAIDPFEVDRAHAEALLRALRLDEARSAFAGLAAKARQDTVILSQYFNLARLVPASEDFHRAAAMIFALKGGDAVADQLVHEAFTTYLANAKPAVRLSSAQIARLCVRFARSGEPRDSARMARLLASRDPDHDELARALLAAAESLHRHGDHESASSLARELRERRPDSSEARMAAALIIDTPPGAEPVPKHEPH
jgi:membrane associated rhomboid family serine protease